MPFDINAAPFEFDQSLLDAVGGATHHIGNVHKYAREAARFGIRPDCTADYHADTDGVGVVYESVCEAVHQVRFSPKPLAANWRSRVDADFNSRKR